MQQLLGLLEGGALDLTSRIHIIHKPKPPEILPHPRAGGVHTEHLLLSIVGGVHDVEGGVVDLDSVLARREFIAELIHPCNNRMLPPDDVPDKIPGNVIRELRHSLGVHLRVEGGDCF
jgi:hypothetical protein